MSALAHWIGHIALGYRPRAERRPVPGLVALLARDAIIERCSIGNISSTGIYLTTFSRWPRNTTLLLRLLKSDDESASSAQEVSIHARVVRHDARGVGLSFVLPPGIELNLFTSPLHPAPLNAGPDQVLQEFKLARVITFLNRICPAGQQAICKRLRHDLSNYRVASAVEIALRAESLLNHSHAAVQFRIDLPVLLRILNDGSWANDNWRISLWAGLLATCSANSPNSDADTALLNAMSQLAAVHARLLVITCRRTTKYRSEDGLVSALPLSLTTDEIIRVAGTHDLHRIDCDLEHLAHLGLFLKRQRSRFFVALDDASMTPSTLGLELYARSHGHSGPLCDFYSITRTDFSYHGAMN